MIGFIVLKKNIYITPCKIQNMRVLGQKMWILCPFEKMSEILEKIES